MLEKEPLEEKLAKEKGFKLSGGGPEEVAERIISAIVSSTGKQELKYLLADKELFIAASYGLGRILAGYETAFRSKYIARFSRFYSNMKEIETRKNSEYLLLKPILTADLNAHIRNVKPFHIVVNILIEKTKNEHDFRVLEDFINAVMSYHRYCGGR